MLSQAIGSTPQPSTPVVRPFSSTAALWVHSHPKSAFLVFCVLAAGYGLALGLGGLSHDTFVSVATVGGVVLLVSAYVLKRLIFMVPLERTRHLLGLKDLNGDEMVYFVANNKIEFAQFYRGSSFYMLHVAVEKFRSAETEKCDETSGISAPITSAYFSEKDLSTIVQTMKENERAPFDMIEFALGMKLPHSSKLKVTVNNKSYEVSFLFDHDTWNITMPHELCSEWHNALPNADVDGSHKLISPTWINDKLANLLRAAQKETA